MGRRFLFGLRFWRIVRGFLPLGSLPPLLIGRVVSVTAILPPRLPGLLPVLFYGRNIRLFWLRRSGIPRLPATFLPLPALLFPRRLILAVRLPAALVTSCSALFFPRVPIRSFLFPRFMGRIRLFRLPGLLTAALFPGPRAVIVRFPAVGLALPKILSPRVMEGLLCLLPIPRLPPAIFRGYSLRPAFLGRSRLLFGRSRHHLLLSGSLLS